MLLGWSAMAAPLLAAVILITYVTWVISSTMKARRSPSRVSASPLMIAAIAVLAWAALNGFAVGVLVASGEAGVGMVIRPYIDSAIAWVLLSIDAGRRQLLTRQHEKAQASIEV